METQLLDVVQLAEQNVATNLQRAIEMSEVRHVSGECIAQCPRDNCYGGCVLEANHFGKHKCGVCRNTWE